MDKTEFALQIYGTIELPPKMTKKYVEKLRKEHPQPLAIHDSATYEFEKAKD